MSIPVKELRGLEDGIFGHEGQAMIVGAPLDKVRDAVETIRGDNELQWGLWLVQLRGHEWTILKSEGPLDRGVVSIANAGRISKELATEVLFCLTEDTSGVIAGCIFRSGESLLMIDNMSGIMGQSSDYESPPQGPGGEEGESDSEFDVVRHLDYYLSEQGTYLPAIWPQFPPGSGVGVTAAGLADADFERVEYIPSDE